MLAAPSVFLKPLRSRQAEAAMMLGHDLLRQFGTLFSPGALLKWHRTLVARKPRPGEWFPWCGVANRNQLPGNAAGLVVDVGLVVGQ